jgi:hypothetical protein
MTIEDVSRELGVSKSKIQRLLTKGQLRRHSSSIKPYLTNDNKHTRLKWCIDMIEQGLLDDPKFKDCLTLCLLMRSGSIFIKNLRGTTCYPMKMNHTALARTRITSLGSCFFVLLLRQDLEMEYVCLMAK